MGLAFLWVVYSLLLAAALGRTGFRAGAPSRAASRAAVDRTRPTRVLIVGATGGTGRALVAEALQRGLTVTALARQPDRLGITHPALRVVQGDVMEPASLAGAMAGQDAVLCALGHRRYLGPSRILSEGTRNLLRAMDAHGVRRLVCESSLGVGDSAGRLGVFYTFLIVPLVLPFYYWDKARQEQTIAASPSDWTLVRPGLLTDDPKRGRVRQGRDVGSYLASVRIARADVAAFMLDQLVSDTYLHAAPGVAW